MSKHINFEFFFVAEKFETLPENAAAFIGRSVQSACEILQMSRSNFYHKMRHNKINTIKIHGRRLILESELAKLLQQKTHP